MSMQHLHGPLLRTKLTSWPNTDLVDHNVEELLGGSTYVTSRILPYMVIQSTSS